MSLGSPSSLYL
jgi:predicted dithiol-disulfide oxidoreductase (DUF899 family)